MHLIFPDFAKINFTFYKKVLLRERKRHTARRVVSTPSVVLPGGGGTRSGTPRGGGTQSGTPPGGLPGPPGGGVPGQVPPGRGGTQSGTPGGVPGQVPPLLPHGILGNVAKHYGIWVPPLWTDRWMDGRTDACQNITFPRTPYAGGKKRFLFDKMP